MKHFKGRLYFLAFLLLFFSPFTYGSSTRETIFQLLKDYSPSGYHLVTRVQELPDKRQLYVGATKIEIPIMKEDFMTWVSGDTEKDILSSIPIVVHEMCHYYTDNIAYQLLEERKVKIPFEDYYEAYYIGNNDDILMKRTEVFNTKEITAIIPEPLHTFRFNYVNSENTLVSQVLGIYGLLDEWNAYYYGTKTAVDLYPYYQDKAASSATDAAALNFEVDCWIMFMDEVNSVYFAYPEFKFFILKYLEYAKANYPEQYQEIIKNKELIKAFNIIDQNFAQLIAKYFTLKEEIYGKLRQEGFTVSETGKYCQITRAKSALFRSVGNYLQTYNLLQNELQKEEYATLLKNLQDLH